MHPPPCIKCKGRTPEICGRSFCPITTKAESMFKVEKNFKQDFFGESPAPFIGRFSYPNIFVGLLSPIEVKDTWVYDAPNHWAKENYGIESIVDLRSALVNSRFRTNVKDVQTENKFIDISKEIGMASKPVDIEINLSAKPRFRLNTSAETAPVGPHAALKKAQITSNPKIHTKVDKVVSDIDFKATNALTYLYDKKFDENFLSKLLSVGTVGVKEQRKLVPTRWSITATDDMLGKHILDEVHDFKDIDYCSYFGFYLGNYYLILMLPDKWGYELFETYMPNTSWNLSKEINYTTDSEGFYGRKTYAENCAGGYYSVRLAILEKLRKMKRQGSVLALRFITGEYSVPLGVWVTRAAARKALQQKAIGFEDKSYMLDYARKLVKKRFGYDLDNILRNSVLLKEFGKQVRLTDF